MGKIEDLIKRANGEGKEEKAKKTKRKEEGKFTFEDKRRVYIDDELYKELVWMKVNENIRIGEFVSEILREKISELKTTKKI